MPIAEDAWLSVRFGHPVYTVAPETDPAELAAHVAAAGRASYQAKVPSADVEAVRRLCGAGLYVVDASVTLGREPAPAAPALPVVDAQAEHAPALLEIAATAFHASRFHLDPRVSAEVAARIKRDWLQSYLDGARGVELLVALDDGVPAGFLAVLEDGGVRVIDLVAVATHAQGRGVGAALTAAFLDRSAGRCARVRVGTQLANVGATRFYERAGFCVERTQYVLHGHTGE